MTTNPLHEKLIEEMKLGLISIINSLADSERMRGREEAIGVHRRDGGTLMKQEITVQHILHSFRTAFLQIKQATREELKEIIGKHNARILNQFQLQGTPEMPVIAYDERVCLIPAITLATEETFEAITKLTT